MRRQRERFERESGDLQGLVHLRMLGLGYDFPPTTIVVPMRPYVSFAECYQFVGRGTRILSQPSVAERILPPEQILDTFFHSELELEQHLEELRNENDMEPWPIQDASEQVTPTIEGAPPSGEYGLTTAGSIGAAVAFTLEEATAKVMEIAEAGRAVRDGRCARTLWSSATAAPSTIRRTWE